MPNDHNEPYSDKRAEQAQEIGPHPPVKGNESFKEYTQIYVQMFQGPHNSPRMIKRTKACNV